MKYGHAVVIGGSVAGLMAAGAASKSFDKVTILERDALPDEPSPRMGVPQGNQIHVILALGLECADEIFPGIEADFVSHGCEVFDESATVPRLSAAGWRLRVDGSPGLGFRRQLLEWVIRMRLLTRPNVHIEHASVRGLVGAADGSRIVGVRLRDGSEIEADLVINASGRRSKAPEWLQELGFSAPVERYANAFMGYATQFVKVPAGAFEAGVLGLDVVPWPGEHRGGALLPADNGLHSLTAIGIMRDYPPRDREGFLAFLDDAPTPLLGQIARRCEPVSDLHVYHQDGNLRRLWEDVEPMPERFLALGDAVASFNPVFGQGMSLAAGSGAIFGRVLSESTELDGVAHKAQRDIGVLADAAFEMSGGFDATFDKAQLSSDLSPPTDLDRSYGRALDELGTEDPAVAAALGRAAFCIRPAELETDEVRRRVEDWIRDQRAPRAFDPAAYPTSVQSAAAVSVGSE